VGTVRALSFGLAKASEIASGSKLGIDPTKKLPGEGFKRPWPPLSKMAENVRKKVDVLFGGKP
jgi:4-hydroxy-3-polyprenylbenzoate decarboxylase